MFPFIIIFLQLICKLVLVVECQEHIELQFTSISPEIDNATKVDINLITNAVERILRPDFDKYPYVILTDQDQHNGILKLVYPEEGRNSPKVEVRIKISKADFKKQVTVFPAGERGFGFHVKQAYIVLRQSSVHKRKHYLNLAYIRRQGKQILIEWSTIDPNHFGKHRLNMELCRGEECDMPQWIFGTCPIVSNRCQLQVPQNGNNPTTLNKWTWVADSPPSYSFGSNAPTNQNSMQSQSSYNSQSSQFNQQNQQSGYNSFGRKKRETATKDGKEEEEEDIPNSLDLLMLKREDPKESDSGSSVVQEAHFENSLVGVREVKLLNDDLECFDCSKMGQFFDDFEEDPEFAQLVGNNARQQYSQKPTPAVFRPNDQQQYRNPHAISGGSVGPTDILKKFPDVPYIGYGHCDFVLEDIQKQKSKEIDDLIEFLMASLRLSCEWSAENRLRSIFRSKNKLIEIQDDFTASISPLSPLTKYKILTQSEFSSVMIALFMAKYTQIYRQEESIIEDEKLRAANNTNQTNQPFQGNGSPNQQFQQNQQFGPNQFQQNQQNSQFQQNSQYQQNQQFQQNSQYQPNRYQPTSDFGSDHPRFKRMPGSAKLESLKAKVSKRTKFLTKLVLSVTETLNKRFSQHLIKGLRMILRFLKDKFLSLLQESAIDKNYHDLIRFMALKEFILYGLGPMAKSGTATETSFVSFYVENQKRIKALVKAYLPADANQQSQQQGYQNSNYGFQPSGFNNQQVNPSSNYGAPSNFGNNPQQRFQTPNLASQSFPPLNTQQATPTSIFGNFGSPDQQTNPTPSPFGFEAQELNASPPNVGAKPFDITSFRALVDKQQGRSLDKSPQGRSFDAQPTSTKAPNSTFDINKLLQGFEP